METILTAYFYIKLTLLFTDVINLTLSFPCTGGKNVSPLGSTLLGSPAGAL